LEKSRVLSWPLTVALSADTFAKVEHFKATNNMGTLSHAGRQLVLYGLLYNEKYLSGEAAELQKRAESQREKKAHGNNPS
jgi:hypothetical protein